MAKDQMLHAKIHPVIAAIEMAGEPTVLLDGYLGQGDGKVVRLYESIEASSYFEIPHDDVIQLDSRAGGETGEVRALVRASSNVLTVRREWQRAGNIGLRPPGLTIGKLPPLESFWTCVGKCEQTFKLTASEIAFDAISVFEERDPTIQAQLLAAIEQRKKKAKEILLFCLTMCANRFGTPKYILIVDPATPSGRRLEPFTIGMYHQMLVEQYLDVPPRQ